MAPTSSGTPGDPPEHGVEHGVEHGRSLQRQGRLRAAQGVLVELSPDRLVPSERLERAALLVTGELATGDLPAAGALAAQLAEGTAAAAPGSGPAVVAALVALGDLAAAEGDHATALTHYRRAGTVTGAAGTWRPGAVMALVRTGDRAGAAALAHEELRLAEAADDARALAVALRVASAADPALDPFASLRRARALASATGDRRLIAQLGADLATLLLLVPSAGSLAEARELLRSAEAYAAGEGLDPLHDRVVRLLARLDERPRPRPGAAAELLTPAEERVARLVVEGLSNRQVAERVGVTAKAVEWHLSRIYRKLGVDSRADLGPLLAGPGR